MKRKEYDSESSQSNHHRFGQPPPLRSTPANSRALSTDAQSAVSAPQNSAQESFDHHSRNNREALAPQGSMFGGGGGRGSARNSNRSNKGKSAGSKGPAPTVYSAPLYDKPYIVSTWKLLGGRGNPNPKWNDNSKGIIANYLSALGLAVAYKGGKAKVGNFDGFRFVHQSSSCRNEC